MLKLLQNQAQGFFKYGNSPLSVFGAITNPKNLSFNNNNIIKNNSLISKQASLGSFFPKASDKTFALSNRRTFSTQIEHYKNQKNRRWYGIQEFFEGGGIPVNPTTTHTFSLKKSIELHGRSWRANELRLKSFQDLHSLWYVLAKERNLVLTEREFSSKGTLRRRRMGLRLQKVKKSMQRIKLVLTERQRIQTYLDHHGHLLPTTRAGWAEAEDLMAHGRNLSEFGITGSTLEKKDQLIQRYANFRRTKTNFDPRSGNYKSISRKDL